MLTALSFTQYRTTRPLSQTCSTTPTPPSAPSVFPHHLPATLPEPVAPLERERTVRLRQQAQQWVAAARPMPAANHPMALDCEAARLASGLVRPRALDTCVVGASLFHAADTEGIVLLRTLRRHVRPLLPAAVLRAGPPGMHAGRRMLHPPLPCRCQHPPVWHCTGPAVLAAVSSTIACSSAAHEKPAAVSTPRPNAMCRDGAARSPALPAPAPAPLVPLAGGTRRASSWPLHAEGPARRATALRALPLGHVHAASSQRGGCTALFSLELEWGGV